MEKKKEDNNLQKKSQKSQQKQNEAERRIAVEMKHQMEESETRALIKAMMKEGKSDQSPFNSSCLKLLNNFQGENE